MEKKTIGQFIAALRRANGMTQKQLAERLNVSDKAVSRWERDECAPDLTLIPVLAEIFSVTSDEILRGERCTKETVTERETEKTEKQISRILKSSMLKFRTRSIITGGIIALGLVAAMICNFGFLRAYIGFFVGTVFLLAAVVCEIIFGLQAFSSVSDEEFMSEAVNRCKLKFAEGMEIIFSAIVVVFAFLMPLVLSGDTYVGLWAESWFAEGLLLSVIAGVIGFFVCWFINIRLANVYKVESDVITAEKNKIKKKVVERAVVLVAVTVLIQIVFNASATTDVLAEKMIFYTTEEFIEFMETPMDWDGNVYAIDEYSNTPSEWFIFDKDGNETDTYYEWNESVSFVQYDWKKGDPAYIVYTHTAVNNAYKIISAVNVIFFIAYLAEIVFVVARGIAALKRFHAVK